MDNDENCKYLMQIDEHGFSISEAADVIIGEKSVEEVRSEKVKREKAHALQKTKPSEWPLPPVVWDLAFERWYLSMDDHDHQSFQQKFPDAEIVWVKTNTLLSKLSTYSQRLDDPFSETNRSKTARLVIHLQDGGSVSPPLVIFEAGFLHVAGGNHRLGWATHIKQEELPILIRGQDRQSILRLLPIERGDGTNSQCLL